MRSRTRRPAILLGAVALGGMALARRSAEQARADADFYTWTGPRPVQETHGMRLMSPAYYHRVDTFGSVHLASYAAVRERLPSEMLHPVRWADGRTVVGVLFMRYHEVTGHLADGTPRRLTPYGEVMVAAMVTRGRAVPMTPMLLQATRRRPSRVGWFVLHLPVTTLEARDLGRELYGFPKFVADMDLVEEPRLRRVRLSEDGAEILTLTVRPSGAVAADRTPAVAYSALRGELLETVMPRLGHRQVRMGGSAGTLAFGDHPVADDLRELRVSPEPLLAMSYLESRLILPAGVPVGPARAYAGYPGADRDRGRLTVEYPGSGPLDCYAEVPRLLAAPAGAG